MAEAKDGTAAGGADGEGPTKDVGPSLDDGATLQLPAWTGETAPVRVREGPGTVIGPYRLLQLIGEGGFGSVFMAEQERPVARRVALKIIKLGMDTGQVTARFEQERQALAIMDHPNIAKVFDAGATELGRPYFVMELCKGEAISEYCDKNSLGIGARLELFAQLCTAVQHAHTKGIIHRDLKPSNVLVSTQDGRPHLKVIDFGIAKATNARLTERTLFTEHRQLIGTPEYMSPEQAEGSLDIDTRTDVYSLGVMLYELLTGSTPFGGTDLRSAAYGEMQRIIREVEPPKPSTRLSKEPGTIASVAAKRRVEPKRLGMMIRGELDWIVMKALEKDRARRYETAEGLAADVRRYLGGEPVAAAPPGAGYKVRKFVRRHRGAVIAGSVAAAALVLGMAGTALGLISARRSEAVAVKALKGEGEQRRLAEGRLAEAEATVRFLDEMLGAADPIARGKDVTVREVLERAEKGIGAQFKDRPQTAARLHGTIGRTYLGLGEYDLAVAHVREAYDILKKESGPESEEACRARNEVGALLIKTGAYGEAESLYKAAIVDHERLFGRGHAATVQSVEGLGMVYAAQNRSQEAEPLAREVLERRLVSPGRESPDTVSAMNTLAGVEGDLGKFEEAEKLFEEASALQEGLTSAEHPLTLQLRSNYSWMLYAAANEERDKKELAQKRLERARDLGEKVLAARERVLGEEHPDTLTSVNNLAAVYSGLGMGERAEPLLKRGMEASVRRLGEEHPDAIVSLANYGNTLRRLKRCEEAVAYQERAVRAARKVLRGSDPGLAFNLGWYGSCLRDLGRYAEAEGPLLEARKIIVKSKGEEHQITREMNLGLQMLYEAWDRAEPGKGYGEKAAEWKGKVGEGK